MSCGQSLVKDFHITEYSPSLRSQVWNLFESGMSQADEIAQDDHTRRAISLVMENARLELAEIGSLSCPKNGGKTFLALDQTKQVIGMLAVRRSEEDIKCRSVELRRISVARDWRRRGICRALVDHATGYINATFDSQQMHLFTFTGVAPAMNAYKSLGFTLEGDDNSDVPPPVVKFVKKL